MSIRMSEGGRLFGIMACMGSVAMIGSAGLVWKYMSGVTGHIWSWENVVAVLLNQSESDRLRRLSSSVWPMS
jgi:hypothetical protein